MYQQMPYDEWYALVKSKIMSAGLPLPEDEELLILAHMECMIEEKSADDFVAAYKAGL